MDFNNFHLELSQAKPITGYYLLWDDKKQQYIVAFFNETKQIQGMMTFNDLKKYDVTLYKQILKENKLTDEEKSSEE